MRAAVKQPGKVSAKLTDEGMTARNTMSGMLVCRSRRVTEPYYVEELGLYLYSGEELSYYIYHNATLISEDFLDERLYRFIGTGLGLTALENKLRKWADQADLTELLLVILQDIHYYDGDELYTFREQLQTLARKTPASRIREKADTLFTRGRYSAAGLYYDRLLHSSEPELRDPSFAGKVWAARGMAYARQYCWQDAVNCLTEAYRLLPRDEIRKRIYQISQIDGTVKIGEELMAGLPLEEADRWSAELSEAWEASADSPEAKQAAAWLDKDNIRRAYGLREVVLEWKGEYRRSLGQ